MGLTLVGVGLSACTTGAIKSHAATNRYKDVQPTLFIHGYRSNYHAEQHMANAAVKAGVTKTIVRAEISKTGSVTLHGKLKASDHHPIVEINYQYSTNPDYYTNAQWAKNVVTKLQKTYNIKNFNFVGHSNGNLIIMYYLRNYANDKKLPKVRKIVDIAGHYNGILRQNDEVNQMKLKSNGRPTYIDSDYRELLKLRSSLPKKQIAFLNIYGDLNNGTHSDGQVSNASTLSLKYLVSGRAKSYQVKKFTGKSAAHSSLHENKNVDKALIKFLWSK